MIPYLLIAVGGIMILAGVKKENPLAILKAVVTNSPIPGTAAAAPATTTPTTTPTTTASPSPNTVPAGQTPRAPAGTRLPQ